MRSMEKFKLRLTTEFEKTGPTPYCWYRLISEMLRFEDLTQRLSPLAWSLVNRGSFEEAVREFRVDVVSWNDDCDRAGRPGKEQTVSSVDVPSGWVVERYRRDVPAQPDDEGWVKVGFTEDGVVWSADVAEDDVPALPGATIVEDEDFVRREGWDY